jgi:hypothetical protein
MLKGARACRCQGRRVKILTALGLLLAAAVQSADAELPSFEDFFRGVSGCSFEMGRYRGIVATTSQGVLIALPSGGAIRGVLVNAFYFAPGRGGNADAYGLVFNAPIEAVARTFPEFTGRHVVNGHLRKLLRLSDETGEDSGRAKTLLMCVGGAAI